MKKGFLAVALILVSLSHAHSQENNPLINSGLIINQAVKLHDEGKYKDAIDLYKKINHSDTNYVWALYESALSYAADSQFIAAIQMCKIALAEKKDIERVPDLLTEYASLLDNIGEPDKALHIFDSAIVLYPSWSPLYLNKGITLLETKKIKEAEQLFQQAILLDPYSASCHYKLGVAALQTGKLVPAIFCFMNYLLVSPQGRYSNNCISLLSAIAKNNDAITAYTDSRTEETPDEYKLVEKIIQSKIALDKNYKPVIELDDPISRQLQVLLEKSTYSEDSKDFFMQYYLPFYKNVFTGGKFEALINYIFSGVNVPQIKEYNKKNKKEIQQLTDEALTYFNKIRATREMNAGARDSAEIQYYFENGKFYGKGKSDKKSGKSIGAWIFYYPYGNPKSKGTFDDKGEKQGNWVYFYMDGGVKATQAFTHGKQTGPEKFYFSNGLVSSEANYEDDNLEAAGNSFHYTGAASIQAQYKKGKLNGERKQFFSNGSLKSIENLTDGKRTGPFSTWFKNGLRESEGAYINDELDGPYKAWFDNGRLSTQGEYAKDKASGQWTKYYESGKLKSTETFLNGKEEGEYTEYYENGQLFTKYIYKKGGITGDVTYNDDDGKQYAVFGFDDNRLVSARYADKTGKVFSESAYKDKKMELISFYTDGARKERIVYNSKGTAEGADTNFYHCGKISQVNEYANGELNGSSTNYFLDGQKSNSLTYSAGKKDGYYTSYHNNGALETEGWYQQDEAQGPWLNYDELGNLTTVNYFLNDELDGHKEEFYVNGKKEYDTRYYHGWIEEMTQYDTAGKIINTVKIEKGSGRFTGVYFDGKLKFEGHYEQGHLDGSYKFYFFDGSAHTLQFYKKGEPDSTYKSYFYGGQVYVEGQFKLGKKSGTWKYYRKNGKISNTEEYNDGELNGHVISWYENGKIEADISYANGQRSGDTKKYEAGGSLIYQVAYKNNLPVSYTYTGKDGKLAAPIFFKAGTGQLTSYYANGQLSAEQRYIEGKINGAIKFYFINGKISSEREDAFDISNGPMKKYYENGQLKAIYVYLNDNLHGPYKEYNDKGMVIEEGIYYSGNYHGAVKLYNDNGKLVETDIYYYGNLLTVEK